MKAALGLLWESRERCPGAAPVLCVHDELVFECAVEDTGRVSEWLVECMTRGMADLLERVPVVVDATVAADWSGTPLEANESKGQVRT
jgi:DNA polymerase I-like protein with 3'-5' exonuclease and polymerase domains